MKLLFKKNTDKWINAEFIVYYEDLENLNKFTASGLQAQASLEKSRLANFNVWQDMTREEKQTSWKWVETCTFWITFILTG